jgi:glyoxylase-like metal-dependent hydrolase (beta-lactamase superfamily II)
MRVFNGSCNSYLYNNILIDAANGIDYKKENIDPDKVVITHEHCDHFSGLDEITISSRAREQSPRGLDSVDCNSIAASRFAADVINKEKDDYGMCRYFSVDYPKKKIDLVLADGDIVEGDGCALSVIETPGHAKGAICLYEEEKRMLFSGDTVFPDLGIPRVDLPSSEPQKLKLTYEKLESLDIKTICPGHGSIIDEVDYIKKVKKLID